MFGSQDAKLLPRLVHVRDEKRLATLVELVREESRGLRPARDVILARLLEVLLISSKRCARPPGRPPRHGEIGIAEVAKRVSYGPASTFSVAFTRYAGVPPTRDARHQIRSKPSLGTDSRGI